MNNFKADCTDDLNEVAFLNSHVLFRVIHNEKNIDNCNIIYIKSLRQYYNHEAVR